MLAGTSATLPHPLLALGARPLLTERLEHIILRRTQIESFAAFIPYHLFFSTALPAEALGGRNRNH
jgi:hypothetical protein